MWKSARDIILYSQQEQQQQGSPCFVYRYYVPFFIRVFQILCECISPNYNELCVRCMGEWARASERKRKRSKKWFSQTYSPCAARVMVGKKHFPPLLCQEENGVAKCKRGFRLIKKLNSNSIETEELSGFSVLPLCPRFSAVCFCCFDWLVTQGVINRS